MFKRFMKESCKSMIWLSVMANELVCALCVAVWELINGD